MQEGQITEAEGMKLRLEQSQRDRRRMADESGATHVPVWFRKSAADGGGERWKFTGHYWSRKEGRFAGIDMVRLW